MILGGQTNIIMVFFILANEKCVRMLSVWYQTKSIMVFLILANR